MDDLKVGNLDSFAFLIDLRTIQFLKNNVLEVVNGCAGLKFDEIILIENRRLKELDMTSCCNEKVETSSNRIVKLTDKMFSDTLKSVRSTCKPKNGKLDSFNLFKNSRTCETLIIG